MFKKIVFITVLYAGFFAEAQVMSNEIITNSDVFQKEKAELVINSNLLLAGEILLYKTHNLTNSGAVSDLSKLMYVTLRNKKDSVVFNHKLSLNEGVAQGDFFLPASLKTGVYTLQAYTNFSRNNQEDAFALKYIYVINPFISSDEEPEVMNVSTTKISLDTSKNTIAKQPFENEFMLSTEKTSFGFREKVNLKITNPQGQEHEGNYTVSVRKKTPVTILNPQLVGKTETPKPQIFYIPELRGELISGKIEALASNLSVANKVVSLTIPGKDYIFKIAKTNNVGRFFFSVDEDYNSSKSVVQVYESNKEQYNLVMDVKELPANRELKDYNLQLNPNIKDWLNERSIQLQIENAYFNIKKDSLLSITPSEPFYDHLGVEYLLDDYTRFPTVKETFVEVVSLAGVRRHDGANKFVVFDAYDPEKTAKFSDIDPLVLVDGMLIQDNEELLNYNAKEIKSIRVLPEAYRYGPKLYSGIIAVITKKGDFKSALEGDFIKNVKQTSVLSNKIYYSPEYSTENSLKRIPDNRVQLLWEPNLSLSTQPLEKSFYTSDVSGTYEVSLEGFTNEGEFIVAKHYFLVE